MMNRQEKINEYIQKIIQKEKYDIDVNVFKIIQEEYQEHFDRDNNKLGCSEIGSCARSTLIWRLFFPGEFQGNMKMLSGKIHHGVIQTPKILSRIIAEICKQLKITDKLIEVEPEKVLLFKLATNTYAVGKYIEGHVDVFTPYFLIEIKTTNMNMSSWSKEIAPLHFIQLNNYLGFTSVLLGYLLKINLRAYVSQITDIDEVWRKYGYFIPVIFDQNIFDKTLDKARMLFKMLEKRKFNMAGPEFPWECKWCDDKVKKICGRFEK